LDWARAVEASAMNKRAMVERIECLPKDGLIRELLAGLLVFDSEKAETSYHGGHRVNGAPGT